MGKVPVPVEPEKPVAASGSSDAAASTPSSSAAPAPASSAATAPAGFGTKKMDIHGLDKVDPRAKFEVFDTILRNCRYATAGLAGNQVYKTASLKAGGMIKIPPAVSIKQQSYRHVDQVTHVNLPEINDFMSYWKFENNCLQQRVGWMFGYYLEDGNYGDKDYVEGTRVCVEGIYEPPQDEVDGQVVMKEDKDLPTVHKIAEALGLECVGFVFTSLLLEDNLLFSPAEIMRAARLQNEYSTDLHFTKYRLSKFVSLAIRPDPKSGMNPEPEMHAFQVSDQCQAMVRAGILTEAPDPKHCVVREAAKDELIPDFLVEYKNTKNIATDWFLVRVVDSQPKKVISMFTHADFPRENRPGKLQTRKHLKDYYAKKKSDKSSWSRFADFHLLIYIAKEFDVDTAIHICECVRDRKEVSEEMQQVHKSLFG